MGRTAASERQSVLDAMEARPSGVWPRGYGHVLLGIPGSPEEEKAYLEPGGSFSPSFGSFGVQVVVENAEGEVEVASDFIPMKDVQQSWVWPRTRGIPGVRTETPEYSATWSLPDGRRWRLDASSLRQPHLVLAIRSVGPAGGPITNAAWDGRSVRLNDRWALIPAQPPREIRLGYQNPTNLSLGDTSTTAVGVGPRIVVTQGPQTEVDRQAGWGRVVLVFDRDVTLSIEDRKPPAPNPLKWSTTRPELTLNLPDEQFLNCLNAQVAQLLMGLVRDETRPGDPNNYPLNWLRDGALVITALARAGQVDVARQLSGPFAREEFFGGFGAEADGPGLSLWTITEVAAILNDSKFDQLLKPHVQRKLALIGEMLTTQTPLRKPWSGPLVPRKMDPAEADLVCEAARDGLIWGRIEQQRPVLYINAVTYAGLRNAERYLLRIRDRSGASQTAATAVALRNAWNRALVKPELQTERTWSCGLHPTWVVSDRATYRTLLRSARAGTHDANDQFKDRPFWTYFKVATAHQWLLLDEPDRAWRDLRWFWENQASPGLYTWWEGNGEENTFDRWETVRGWVNPPYVSPHYGTAAEILALQLSLLAYVDSSGPQPQLVVGAGIPDRWLPEKLSVAGLRTTSGPVAWDWDGRRLRIRAPGFPRGSIRAAGPFAAGIPLEIN